MAQAKAAGVKTPINAVLYTCDAGRRRPDRAAILSRS